MKVCKASVGTEKSRQKSVGDTNTELLWRSILVVLSKPLSWFITRTEIYTTTGLITCNLRIAPTMLVNTLRVALGGLARRAFITVSAFLKKTVRFAVKGSSQETTDHGRNTPRRALNLAGKNSGTPSHRDTALSVNRRSNRGGTRPVLSTVLTGLGSRKTLKSIVGSATVLVVSVLTLGVSYPEPKFLAVANDLAPPPVTAVKPSPVVIQRTVQVEQSEAPVASPAPVQDVQVGGGAGYIMPGNNCVACVMALTGRAQSGNAGSHVPAFSTPRVGAIMIWYPGEQGASGAGHVGVVVSVNSDGSVEIAHCNWPSQTTFASTGKFY